MLERWWLDYYEKDEVISSWKTKTIHWVKEEPYFVIMENNDNISSGDWERIEEWEWKAELSTEITSNMFEYLNGKWIRTHYLERLSSTEILVEKCDMLPVECVFRYVATWSYIKREKYIYWDEAIEDWTLLDMPLLELFYKNDVLAVNWEIISDPMIKIWENGNPEIDFTWKLCLINPKTWLDIVYTAVFKPDSNTQVSSLDVLVDTNKICIYCVDLFKRTLECWYNINKFWSEVWIDTFDGKVEFWLNKQNELVLADVIDWDSCRLRIPYVVEWDDWKNYLTWDFLPGELEKNTWHNLSYFEKLGILPEWMKIKKYVWVTWLDKDWYRAWWSVNDTVRKYKVLAEKSSEALSKSKSSEKVSNETIEKVMKVIEKI